MRHAISFTLICLASFSTGALFLGCSADDDEERRAGSGRGGSGGYDLSPLFQGSDGGPQGGSGGQGGNNQLADASDDPATPVPEAGPPSCEACGSAESVKNCGAALAACRADVGCQRIYDCIYTYRGCGLTSSDIDCVRGCFDDYCEDENSVALYLAYDQCTYCSPVCEDACSSYCSSFPKDGVITSRCSDSVSDAGNGETTDGAIEGEGGADQTDAAPDVPDEPEPVCVPGRQEKCACPGGAEGAQICNSEGTGFGACFCPAPGEGGDEDNDDDDDDEDD